ncbi:rab3 GTPase-activating protein non-catalytic subunit [Diorhabda sublineata]|uniref:rab3 GTPase-activating protein non-catalytic subunit n=1 Tax=Diorhabda sublineata TaxID=1163346 RepID=UPI0024E15453|nr:rab3 GTPase-activating protein non-catalytic subunit [Diorhabda sublineata]
MSSEIRVTSCIKEIDKIRKCLFPTDDHRGTDSWLHFCKISVAPTGDLIVIANDRKIVVLTSKWDPQSSMNIFQIFHSGYIHEYDKVKAVLCVCVVDQNGNSRLGADWNCIIVGFDSGHVRFYTENCDLIFEEQFHAENITTIKCRSQHNPRSDLLPNLHPEEIYIQYQSTLCVLKGPQLFSTLRHCRSQPDNNDIVRVVPKKWGFLDQSVINDSAVVGLNLSNTFDHLLVASTSRGFNSRCSNVPPTNTIVVAAGSKPFLGYHFAFEGGGMPVLSDVAKAVAMKLKSTLPSWLIGSKNVQEKQLSVPVLPADAMTCRFGLCDLRRAATDIILSADHRLAAVCDSLGRILLIDTFKGIVIRMFKGYREAQCSFIQVPDERRSKHRLGNKVAHFLVVYSPRRGTLEVFSLQQGSKIAIFSASKHSKLVYINYGLVGFTKTLKSQFVCQYTTVFIDGDGLIKEISIPFHFALSEKHNKRARDIHLYKKYRNLLKTDADSDKLLNEALNTCTELKTTEGKKQMVELLLENKNIPPEVAISCVKYFLESLEDEDTINLKILCQNSNLLLELFVFVSNFEGKDTEKSHTEQDEFSVKVDVKEMSNLQKLLDLSVTNDNINLPEVHVKFSNDHKFSGAEFLSIFDYTKSDSIVLKPKVDEDSKFKASEILFKPYIEGTFANISELQERLVGLKIPTEHLFDLLVNYWVNRSLRIDLNLEKEIQRLSNMLYILLKVSNEDINPEYGEVSTFWSRIREFLAISSRPFPALMAAILCKNVARKFEIAVHLEEFENNLEDMEVLTQENVEWSLLISKLEDVSLLNIILSIKPVAKDCPLPKLTHKDPVVSLNYVLQKGKGSVSELVAQWLTKAGINPLNINLNEDLDKNDDDLLKENWATIDHSIKEENLFLHINLLKKQFPYSVNSNYLLTNMSWEYASAWQKDMQNLDLLEAAISCLNCIRDVHIRQGLYQLIWNTHLKIVSESASKLINKVGKVPKERLCKQETGLTDYQMSLFSNILNKFLDSFMQTAIQSQRVSKAQLNFENIWDNGGQPLVELAVQQKLVNFELLHVHYQLSLVLLMIITFSIKYSKPINNLFDTSVGNLFFTDMQKKLEISCNKSDTKLNSSRSQFLFKIISASLETVTVDNSGEIYSTDHVHWTNKCLDLGGSWNLEVDELRRYQVVQLYVSGYDSLAYRQMYMVKDRKELGKCLLKVTAKRLSHYLASSPDYCQNITCLTTMVTHYMETLGEEWCAPATIGDITLLAKHTLHCFSEEDKEYKLAYYLHDGCSTIQNLQ